MAKSLIVKQTGSTIGSQQQHVRTIKALGLGKMNRVRTLPDNPSVRGMLHHVRHLVEVTEEE